MQRSCLPLLFSNEFGKRRTKFWPSRRQGLDADGAPSTSCSCYNALQRNSPSHSITAMRTPRRRLTVYGGRACCMRWSIWDTNRRSFDYCKHSTKRHSAQYKGGQQFQWLVPDSYRSFARLRVVAAPVLHLPWNSDGERARGWKLRCSCLRKNCKQLRVCRRCRIVNCYPSQQTTYKRWSTEHMLKIQDLAWPSALRRQKFSASLQWNMTGRQQSMVFPWDEPRSQ